MSIFCRPSSPDTQTPSLTHSLTKADILVIPDSASLWTVAHHAPLSMGFSRQEYWSGLPCLSPGDLPNPRVKPASLVSPVLTSRFFITSATWEALPQRSVIFNFFSVFEWLTIFFSGCQKIVNLHCCLLDCFIPLSVVLAFISGLNFTWN